MSSPFGLAKMPPRRRSKSPAPKRAATSPARLPSPARTPPPAVDFAAEGLACPLCRDLLYEPVLQPCGQHSVCRGCLVGSLASEQGRQLGVSRGQARCAECQATGPYVYPKPGVFSRVLHSQLEQRYPDEFAQRRAETDAEARTARVVNQEATVQAAEAQWKARQENRDRLRLQEQRLEAVADIGRLQERAQTAEDALRVTDAERKRAERVATRLKQAVVTLAAAAAAALARRLAARGSPFAGLVPAAGLLSLSLYVPLVRRPRVGDIVCGWRSGQVRTLVTECAMGQIRELRNGPHAGPREGERNMRVRGGELAFRTSASFAYGFGRAYQHNYNDGAFDPNGRPSGPVWLESEMRVIRIAGTVETVRLAAAFAFCVDVAAALRGDASAAPSALADLGGSGWEWGIMSGQFLNMCWEAGLPRTKDELHKRCKIGAFFFLLSGQWQHVVELLLPGWAVGARLVYAGTVSAFGCGLAHLDYECCRLHSGMSVLFWVFLGAQIRLTARAAALVLPGIASSMCVAGGSTEECEGAFHVLVVVPGYLAVLVVWFFCWIFCCVGFLERESRQNRSRAGIAVASTLFCVAHYALINAMPAMAGLTIGVLQGNYTLGA